MSSPLLSVIVLSYNRRDELRECLASVFAQDYDPLEVVVLENGSTDGSAAMIRSEYPAAQLVELDENVGACAGRNRAFEHTSGDLIVQVDNDATIEPADAFSRMVERFKKEDDLGIAFARIVDPATGRIYRPGYGDRHLEKEFYTWRFHGCLAMIRLRAIHRAGYYLPEEFFRAAEENDLAVRVLDAGYNILYFPEAAALHKLSPRARYRAEITYLTVRNNLRVAWKFFPLTRAAALTLWRVPHYCLSRLARGEGRAFARSLGILAAQRDALRRRRRISRDTMRIIDQLTLEPALTLEDMRRLREKAPRVGYLKLLENRLAREA